MNKSIIQEMLPNALIERIGIGDDDTQNVVRLCDEILSLKVQAFHESVRAVKAESERDQLKAQLAEARMALVALHSTGHEMSDLLATCRDDTDASHCLVTAWDKKETKHKDAIDAAKEGGK